MIFSRWPPYVKKILALGENGQKGEYVGICEENIGNGGKLTKSGICEENIGNGYLFPA